MGFPAGLSRLTGRRSRAAVVPTRPRVLLVDDHPGVAKVLGRVLSTECDVVGVIADGREAADAAARLQPVVIVVDLNLPDVSGLDVCRQLREHNPRAKVIVISAMSDEDVKDEVLAAGASGFFNKSAARELAAAIVRIWTEPT
jgi:two-component system, NarL family, response regulator NreC